MYKLLVVILFSVVFTSTNAEDRKNPIVYRVNGKIVSQKKFDANTLKQHRKIVKERPDLFEIPTKTKKS